MSLISVNEIAHKMRCDENTALILVLKAGGDKTGVDEEIWINFLRSFKNILTTGKLKGSRGIIICVRDDFKCHYCKNDKNLTYDHIIPRSKGGSNKHTNIVLACYTCNQLKGDLSVEDFLEKLKEKERIKKELQPLQPLTANLVDLLKFKGHVIKFGAD